MSCSIAKGREHLPPSGQSLPRGTPAAGSRSCCPSARAAPRAAQRIDVGLRRAALLLIDQIELEERPAFDRFGFDRAAPVLALDGHPLEVLVRILVHHLAIQLVRAGQAERAHGDEGFCRTAVTAQFLDHHHVVGAKAQRVQQPRGRDFRWDFRRAAVLHANTLAVLEPAIELRRGAAELVDLEGAVDAIAAASDRHRAARCAIGGGALPHRGARQGVDAALRRDVFGFRGLLRADRGFARLSAARRLSRAAIAATTRRWRDQPNRARARIRMDRCKNRDLIRRL